MVSTAKFVGIRPRNKQEKSSKELICALKPYISRALDRSQGNSQSELTILIRHKSEEVVIEETESERQRLEWADNLKPQSYKGKLLEGWEEQKALQMERTMTYCESVIPSMIAVFKSDSSIVSREIVLKFRNGKFAWSAERTESQFDH